MSAGEILTVAGGIWGAATVGFVVLVVYLGTRNDGLADEELAEVVQLDSRREYEGAA